MTNQRRNCVGETQLAIRKVISLKDKMSVYVTHLLAEADKIRAKIENDAEVMEQMRLNQVKLEEKLKAEVAKNVTLEAKQSTLEKTLASKEESNKVLKASGADRKEFRRNSK